MAPETNPIMSTSSRTLLDKARRLVPPMLEKFHKGQLGRVAVIGGSADYTGAPYFSAMASAKLGCDMSHVICEPSAATVIKSYSPNLMVHPLLQSSSSLSPNRTVSNSDDQKSDTNQQPTARQLAEPIISFLPRLHVLIIGPGLGRDSLTQRIVSEVISEARSRNIPMVMDADALLLIQEQPALINGYTECILTPNVVEFGRLCKALGVKLPSDSHKTDDPDESTVRASEEEACKRLSNALGGVLIIQKGKHDVISNGLTSIISDIEGGRKRSGGQGDTLTGSVGTFLAWRKAYHDGLWGPEGGRLPHDESEPNYDIEAELYGNAESSFTDKSYKMSHKTTLLLSAWAGSAITRECSRRAYLAKGRSMQASDLTEEVHESFMGLIGEPEGSKL